MRKTLKKFRKHDSAKSRLDLLPPRAIEQVGFCLRTGALVYSEENWAKCSDPTRYVAAMLRHTMKHLKGEFTDLESGNPHLACAITNGLFALDLYLRGVQDRTMGNYLAVVKRVSKHRGKILKRFRGYDPALNYMRRQGLDPDKYLVKSVPAAEKAGMKTNL